MKPNNKSRPEVASESATIKEYPAWVEWELSHPKDLGDGRNNQMIKIGPALLRCGHDVDSLYELFCNLYPDANSTAQQHEIMSVCKSATRYVEKQDKTFTKSAYVKWQRHLTVIANRMRAKLPWILEAYQWPPEEFTCPTVDLPLWEQRRLFLSTLFEPDDVVWIGNVWETGKRTTTSGRQVDYRDHFQPVDDWLGRPIRSEFVSHCTFQTGSNSRNNESVAKRCYIVVESDVLTVSQSGAVFNYLANACELNLRAIVSTGGKSIHGWFDWPIGANDVAMAECGAVLSGLKCDPATLRPSQPVRLPGCIRRDKSRPQELLYI
jgi:hypothetical protein